ncbi:MAG: tripartite tricarboxylate transporter TctB family protein [Betaproteobacteria bacterium]|nr:tripartite tricarboxylate transporter TctB family protein [Betaproteobacteria bacterium]
MSNESSGQEDDASAASTRALEVATALFFLVIGCLVMWDSQRQGAGWGDDGPQSGYFPFYIGLLMSAATLVNLFKALRYGHPTSFVSKGKIKLVMAIFVPCLFYVGAMQMVGLYVASTVFIAAFMRWRGKFSWMKSAGTGLGVSVALFLMFEVWFKVPLLKGPLEAALGY